VDVFRYYRKRQIFIWFETVNARNIASRLKCSIRPIFTCYENMDELKKEFLDFASNFYEKYITDYGSSANISSYLLLSPLIN